MKRLREKLKPQSELHQRRDIHELRGCIVQIQDLFTRLPASGTRQLQDDLRLAVKGIVEGRKVKKKDKPELCMDDTDAVYVD